MTDWEKQAQGIWGDDWNLRRKTFSFEVKGATLDQVVSEAEMRLSSDAHLFHIYCNLVLRLAGEPSLFSALSAPPFELYPSSGGAQFFDAIRKNPFSNSLAGYYANGFLGQSVENFERMTEHTNPAVRALAQRFSNRDLNGLLHKFLPPRVLCPPNRSPAIAGLDEIFAFAFECRPNFIGAFPTLYEFDSAENLVSLANYLILRGVAQADYLDAAGYDSDDGVDWPSAAIDEPLLIDPRLLGGDHGPEMVALISRQGATALVLTPRDYLKSYIGDGPELKNFDSQWASCRTSFIEGEPRRQEIHSKLKGAIKCIADAKELVRFGHFDQAVIKSWRGIESLLFELFPVANGAQRTVSDVIYANQQEIIRRFGHPTLTDLRHLKNERNQAAHGERKPIDVVRANEAIMRCELALQKFCTALSADGPAAKSD